jgi:hypothetical protein
VIGVPTAWLDWPGVIRRPRPVRRVRLTLTPSDDPKITAKANDTLKWTVHPPRRRFDLLPAANFRRSGRSRSAFHRPPTTRLTGREVSVPRPSSCSASPSGPNRSSHLLVSWNGCSASPSGPNRSSHLPMVWSGCPRSDHFPKDVAVGWTLERPGSSSRVSTPASFRLRRFSRPWRFAPLRALRRVSVGHARGVFFRKNSTCWRSPSKRRSEDQLFSRIPSWSTRGHRVEDHRSDPASNPLLASQEWCLVVSLQGFDPPNRPGPLSPSAVASDSTGAAIPGLGGVIRGEPKSTSRHTLPPDNGCRLVRPEGRTLLSSRKLRLIPRRPSALPEGGVSVRSRVGFHFRSRRRRPRA